MTSKDKRLNLIAPAGSPETRVRLVKANAVFRDMMGFDVHYWGWQRGAEEDLGASSDMAFTSIRAILRRGGYKNRLAKLMYGVWFLAVFFNVIFRRPKRVYCLGLETAGAAWLARFLNPGMTIIFDDADRLVEAVRFPAPIKRVLKWLEKRTSRGSAAHILPSLELYDYRSPTMHVIRNVPASTDIAAAKALVDASEDDGTEEDKHVIAFVNGTVDRSRNIDTIIETAEMLLAMDKDIARFKIATNKAIQTTKTGDLPQNFIHLGGLPQRESLAEYARCDLVLTFCDADMVASYKYAWPNKWGDAIAMGTPIVVNGDMVHARQFIEAGAGFDCPCGDAQAFADLLIALHEDRDRLKAASNAIEGFQDTFRPFDIELAAILNTVEADTKSG